MAQQTGEHDWRFLFREERGRIDAAAWRSGFAMLAAPILGLTVVWFLLLPFANRDLNERLFLDPMTLVAYGYLILFVAAVLLGGVCFYFLSAKRWRDLGRPPSFAGLPLFAALLSGAAHWLWPRVSDVMPHAIVVVLDLALIAVCLWQAYELGVRPSKLRP